MAAFKGLLDALRDPKNSQGLLDMGISLMGASGPSPVPMSFGQRLAQGYVGSQQMAAERAAQAMRQKQMEIQQKVAEAQLAKLQQPEAAQSPFANIDPSKYTPESVTKFQTSGNYGDLQPITKAGGEDSPFGKVNPGDYTPASLAKYAKTGDYNDLQRTWAPQPAWIGQIGGGLGAIRRDGGGVGGPEMITTAEQEAAAAAAAKAAQAGAAVTGEADAKNKMTLESDVAALDDEIERNTRLLAEFKSGVYQTGPLAGRLPNVRAAASNLAREQSSDVLKKISTVTLGSISEGELALLGSTGISDKAPEESNVRLLEERLSTLKRVKERRLRQGSTSLSPTTKPKLAIGTVQDGYEYTGGDPASRFSWKKK